MKHVKRSSVRKATGSKTESAARRKSSKRRPKAAAVAVARKPVKPARTLPRPKPSPASRGISHVPIPEILLEGDSPGTAPTLKSKVAATDPSIEAVAITHPAVLPEAYGTQRLKLTPRDPHWIHAHWDFTRKQLRDANARSADGHLVLKLFKESTRGPLVSETRLHRESVRWFVHAPEPNIPYAAEIGFYNPDRRWLALAASDPVHTPPSGPSKDHGFELATLAPGGRVERHATIKQFRVPPVSLVNGESCATHAPASPNFGGWDFPGPASGFPGSADLTASAAPEISSWSSGPAPGSFGFYSDHPAPFRLNVNAELIVHGSTEPDATLKIGGRIIPLQPDGSFHFRFSLPDAQYTLPAEAISAKTGEHRTVELRFSRQTEASSGVGETPQDPALKPPGAENL